MWVVPFIENRTKGGVSHRWGDHVGDMSFGRRGDVRGGEGMEDYPPHLQTHPYTEDPKTGVNSNHKTGVRNSHNPIEQSQKWTQLFW